jgi:hypothetical protein
LFGYSNLARFTNAKLVYKAEYWMKLVEGRIFVLEGRIVDMKDKTLEEVLAL